MSVLTPDTATRHTVYAFRDHTVWRSRLPELPDVEISGETLADLDDQIRATIATTNHLTHQEALQLHLEWSFLPTAN
jgi:hypothetical protein